MDSIPVAYDFTVTNSDNDRFFWDVSVCMVTDQGQFCNSGSGVTPKAGTPQTVSGGFSVPGLLGATLQSWSADLLVNFASNSTFSANDTIEISVPADSSIDIGPLNQTPEPGTAWLLAAGVALLSGFRKRFLR